MGKHVLPACTPMDYMHALLLMRPRESIKSPKTRVTDGCELSSGCWEQT